LEEQNRNAQIVRDLAETSIIQAIEDSLVEYQVSFARLPGAVVEDRPELLWVASGVPFTFCNGVFRSVLDPLSADATIEEMQAEFGRRQLPMRWQLGPSARPGDLRQRLLAHDFVHEEDEPAMALDLLAMNEDFPTPHGLAIRLVEDIPTLNKWLAVWVGAPNALSILQLVHAQLGVGPHLPWRYYLGTVDGKPVATALLFSGAGVAAVHWVVTLQEARGRGIGTAMTLAVLHEARRQGYRLAVLTASPYGINIYRRIGFREYATISKYNWRP
jgi:GNAT superfamily N-acetyltransferase